MIPDTKESSLINTKKSLLAVTALPRPATFSFVPQSPAQLLPSEAPKRSSLYRQNSMKVTLDPSVLAVEEFSTVAA